MSHLSKIKEKIMILDTETSGLPETISFGKWYDPKMHLEKYRNSRLIELGYKIMELDENEHKELKRISMLVKPIDFAIENEHIHGITHELAMKEGIDRDLVLNKLYEDMWGVNKIVGHNIDFDINVILAECYRSKNNLINEMLPQYLNITPRIDTMKIGLNLIRFKIPNEIKPFVKTDFVKSPRLSELYTLLYGEVKKQDHRALSDVDMCYDCYVELRKIF